MALKISRDHVSVATERSYLTGESVASRNESSEKKGAGDSTDSLVRVFITTGINFKALRRGIERTSKRASIGVGRVFLALSMQMSSVREVNAPSSKFVDLSNNVE